MQKIKYPLIICLSFFLLFLMSFQTSDQEDILTIEKLIQKEIDRKLAIYKRLIIKKCDKNILEEAGKRADSIIIRRAKALKVLQDTITRPIAPDRPNKPDLLKPIDSSAAAPFLNGDSLIIKNKDE